ncbi:MAG: hypothetical protein COB16_00670 [Rhodobacteraceae bacterium]|nr:MAG: hypothetical protein COB16_00670 [Paracoccaceae bacterium]
MATFDKFISNCRELNELAIRSEGFSAVPFPELLTSEELIRLSKLVADVQGELWSFEYGKRPKKFCILLDEKGGQVLWRESYKNTLFKFSKFDLFIWSPEEHEYFVIFGETKFVDLANNLEIFPYSFGDYLDEESFSNKKLEYLANLRSRFSI